MGCCQSRYKDYKDKENGSPEEGSNKRDYTIKELINNNMKKRHKSFLVITQKQSDLQKLEIV